MPLIGRVQAYPKVRERIHGDLKGRFETAPCRATLATPFPTLCPRILGTWFTKLRFASVMGWINGDLKKVIWDCSLQSDSEHPIFSPLSKHSRNTVYKLRFASLRKVFWRLEGTKRNVFPPQKERFKTRDVNSFWSSHFLRDLSGLPSLQKCFCENFGEIWLGIRFEIWNFRWEKSGEMFGGGLFSTCQESTKKLGANFGANFGATFGENFGNFASNFATFFGKLRSAEGRC